MNKPLVSVIIVNWNGRHFLDDCLNSLSKITYKKKEILFVDNASTDDSVLYVKKYFPHIKIITNAKNLGFAQGNEIGFKESKGEAILLLNTDTIVEKNLLDELTLALYERKDIGAVQPKILLYPEKNLIDSIGSFFLGNGDLYHFGREKDHKLFIYNKPMEIFSAKGACILFKKEILEHTGLFDKDYFAYFEETDLCMKIWLSGHKVLYTPNTIVYHKGGGASKQIDRSHVLFHSQKNRILTYLKNLSSKYLWRVLPTMIFLYQCVFILYVLTGKLRNAVTIQKAILWNVFHMRDTLRKRSIIQNTIRRVSDDDFLPKLTKDIRLSYYYYQFFGGMGKYKD